LALSIRPFARAISACEHIQIETFGSTNICENDSMIEQQRD
jgi:hypothetical protein